MRHDAAVTAASCLNRLARLHIGEFYGKYLRLTSKGF